MKPIVVLADLDANYLIPLEDKLTEEMFKQVELEIITEQEYFDKYFSVPRKIDTLIVSSALYSQDLLRHNIDDLFVLTEDVADVQSTENVTHIFKYSSTKEIFNQIVYKNKDILNVQSSHKETQVIVVTSAIGGSGKTTLSLALSDSLARNHKRVFYISTDVIQSFTYYLQNKNVLPNDIVRQFSCPDEKLFSAIMPYFRNEGFTYLPAFSRSILSLGLDSRIFNKLIEAVRITKEFDYIIVDTEINLDDSKAELLKNADKVIINVLQDMYSVFKTEYLVKNIDCRNSDKYVFVCNKFRRDIENDYIMSEIGQQYVISEYIEEVPAFRIQSLDSFTELTGVKNLAYIFT